MVFQLGINGVLQPVPMNLVVTGTPAITCTPTPRLGPPAQLLITVQDNTGTGLASIVPTATNASVDVPPLSPPTSSVVVTATKIDQSRRATVSLLVTNEAGISTTCDPVVTLVKIPAGSKSVRQTFTEIPREERFITVQNADPGLKRLPIRVNGKQYEPRSLQDNDERTVDVSASMVAVENTITLLGYGQPGASALVTISDSRAGQANGTSSESGPAEQLQGLPDEGWKEWHQRTGLNLNWGHQVE